MDADSQRSRGCFGEVRGHTERACVCVFVLQAYTVLGQFLLLRKDGELFAEWLKDTSGANEGQAKSCTDCLTEWCNAFL